MLMLWILLIVLALMIPEILSTVLESRLGRAIAVQIENRGQGEAPEPLAERMRYLEGEVDRLSEQVRRLTRESEFLQDLLSERSSHRKEEGESPRPPLPPGDRTS
jgi:hypothetical protein